MVPPTDPPPSSEPEESKNDNEFDELMSKAQDFMAKVIASHDNPNPKLLHALASVLENEESRYVQESGHSSFSNGRASHNIGRLGNLVRENDEFFEMVSSKFLSESRYSLSIRSAAARLLLACSPTWLYPHVFEDVVLENIKGWVMDGAVKVFGDEDKLKFVLDKNKPSDSEMLRAYATGLLALALTDGGQVVEDVLTSGLSAKLMRFLRLRVLGETNLSQKDSEGKHTSGATFSRGREENKGRIRQVADVNRVDGSRMGDEGLLDEQNAEIDHEVSVGAKGDECLEDGAEIAGEDKKLSKDLRDGKSKYGDADENVRDDFSRRRANRGPSRVRGVGEGVGETERTLTSPVAGLRLGGQGRHIRDRNQSKVADSRKAMDAKKDSTKIDGENSLLERDDNDDCFKECKIGTKDISDLVRKATMAAEAEARSANAPAEAVKAAGDAAAEFVKTAALESLKSTNDEDAALLAASKAASTVVDAAVATEVSRSCSSVTEESLSSETMEPEKDEELGFFILDAESLAQLREQYCIQCLEVLGGYVEVLGPVLHEKGVDVCLALLQRSSKSKEGSRILIMLPEVLKLICALAAHRKFAALFVDRGGMQKLLAVQRVSQTFTGLSLCLFTIGSLQGIMERVCALPSDVVHQLVELALQLLECSQDQARKNAALFFAAAFVFRGVLDSFDAQDGLQKMLNLLHSAASVRSGVNNLAAHRNDRAPAEVLTASEKQIAYHTCFALRQYFRANLLLLVDSIRPIKSHRSGARNILSARAAYKPLDISNESMDAVFLQLQRDRKLGPAFVRARWPAVDRFLGSNGHITLLELCQAPPVERYLHDLAQYALGVLHIVTLVPYSRKPIINATLSNERLGMAVILDAANGAGYVDPEVIQPALNLLVNLVCPPPCLSNKPFVPLQGQQNVSVQSLNGPSTENRERNVERNISDRTIPLPIQNEPRERNGEPCAVERGGSALATPSGPQSTVPSIASGVVGDRRISLGPGAGCAGLAAHMELGYRQAREAVRANNGIKILLHLLHPRILTPPATLDCLRALACRVLLGLARDDTIAHILTKLQVGKSLSELIRDSSSQATGAEQQGRWQDELSRAAMELIAIVTNSGRACTLAASDAAAPTLRRIERAAIAAATPISYHSRELLLLMHEHLQASGLTTTADALMKEAQLTPLPCLATPPAFAPASSQETSSTLFQWPSGNVSCGFLSDTSKLKLRDHDLSVNPDFSATCLRKKPLAFSPNLSPHGKAQLQPLSVNKVSKMSGSSKIHETQPGPGSKPALDTDLSFKTPIVLPMKRKLMESKDTNFCSPLKKVVTYDVFHSACQTPNASRRMCPEPFGFFSTQGSAQRDSCSRPSSSSILTDNLDDIQYQSTPVAQMPTAQSSQLGLLADLQAGNIERVTLDSLVVQYLKHQHRQCSAPITTLPPLSLLHPHVCPEPSRSLDAPANVTARLSTRECRKQYCSAHSHRRDRQFVFSRFRPWRTCRDEAALLTCITFPGDSSQIVTGSHSGELKIFDSNSGNMLESHSGHQSPITLVQSAFSGGTQLVLSSGTFEVRLWDVAALSGGPMHSFEGCKAARFNHTGAMFAALSSEASRREVLLYDVQTCNLEQKLSDNSVPPGPLRGHVHSPIHFSPSDTMLLWNGVLWDRRVDGPLHRFDQFTDYGGGGFHPAGNEVIINSEVWDLRKFKLLRSVPSLDQTVITFNAGGDIIYAILRRNLEDITSAVQSRRVKHPLFPAFRTVDAVNYSDIATVQVDRCVLDFATEPTDSFVGVVAMDNHEEMFSLARLYEIGRRRPTEDDSDPDDGVETDEEDDDDDDDSEADEDPLAGTGLDGVDSDADDLSNDDEEDSMDDDLDDGDYNSDDADFDGGGGILEIVSEDDDDDSPLVESFSSDEEGEYGNYGVGF